LRGTLVRSARSEARRAQDGFDTHSLRKLNVVEDTTERCLALIAPGHLEVSLRFRTPAASNGVLAFEANGVLHGVKLLSAAAR
jgi:hypothetical protein